MPVLNTKEDLVAALQNSLFAADPIADLAQKGFTLSPALNAEWQTARAGKKLAPIAPKLNPSAFKTKFVFQSAPSSLPVFDIPPGSYDLTAGLTVAAANEVLAAEYQSGFIPHQIALDQSLSPADLLFLAGFFKVDRPGGRISKLHITAAPTLSATTDGSEIVALQIPIQIDWDRTVHFATGQVQQLVTTATGTMTLTMSLVGSMGTTAATMNIAITLVVDPSSAAESPHLILDASSPVQLKSMRPPKPSSLRSLSSFTTT